MADPVTLHLHIGTLSGPYQLLLELASFAYKHQLWDYREDASKPEGWAQTLLTPHEVVGAQPVSLPLGAQGSQAALVGHIFVWGVAAVSGDTQDKTVDVHVHIIGNAGASRASAKGSVTIKKGANQFFVSLEVRP